MPKRKRQIILDTRSNTCLCYILNIAEDGVFSKIPLDHVGFDPYVLDQLRVHRITVIGQLIGYSPASLRKKRYLQSFVIEMMDALDEYFCNAFEEGKKAYRKNPLPVYRLIGLKDISRYRNYLLYDFNIGSYHDNSDINSLRAHGIITLQDYLKMNLLTYHEYGHYEDDASVRAMLMHFRTVLDTKIRIMLPVPYPLDEPESQVISCPLPARAAYTVSSLTDDRIAGDEVSTDGLTPYEKALYDRTREAIDDCGGEFYYDVLDNREFFESLEKSLAVFRSPVLELMQRRIMLRNLYMSVPERFRRMPARALYHYMVPRRRDGHYSSPYTKYASYGREVRFLRSWELFHGQGRMMPLEDCYRHLEKQLDGCESIEEFDNLIETDCDWQLLDLFHWLANVSMLTAVWDNFLRDTEYSVREATDERKALVPETNPDETIARFTLMNHSKKPARTGLFDYYERPYSYTWFGLKDRYKAYRYDFFAVYMLLTGKTSVPFDLARGLLRPEDAISLANFFSEFSNYIFLYDYNPDTDMVTMKPHALQW